MKKHYFSRNLMLIVIFSALFSNIHAQSQVVRIKFKENQTRALNNISTINTSDGIIQTGIKAFDQLNDSYSVSNIKRVFPYAGKYEKKHQKYGLHLWYEVTLESEIALSSIVKSYQLLSEISFAETIKPTKLYIQSGKQKKGIINNNLTTAVNDPRYVEQWHYNNTGQSGGTVDADIDLPEAWAIETGSPDVVVSIHDGGIDYDHKDLDGNMWVNTGEIPGNGIDDDNNGYIDDIYGYNFIYSSPGITPIIHGTHVGGTVAAETNNGTGMAGVAGGTGNNDGVRIMSAQIFTDATSGGHAASYVYAADNGAVISQNSWGYTKPGIYEQAVLDAIDYFIAEAGYDEDGNQVGPMAGGIVIFAAGNEATNDKWYPGYYEPILSVAATDHNDEGAIYSNYGEWVELAAPGTNVQSTYPYDDYGSLSGTSMACPHVSGVAALIVSKYKDEGITPAQVWARLVNSTDSLTFTGADGWGSGRLNAFKALLNEETEAPDAIADLSVAITGTVTATFTFTAPADQPNGYSVCLYDLRGSESVLTAGNFNDAERFKLNTPKSPGTTETITVSGLTPGKSYYFAIKSADFYGNTSDISNIVSFTTQLAPEIAVAGNPSVNIDVSVDSTQSGNFTIANNGQVDLDFEIAATYLGRTAPTSTLVYPGTGLSSNDVKIVSDAALHVENIMFDAEPVNTQDAELNFKYEYENTLIYDDHNDGADGTLGASYKDNPIKWSSASFFEVPVDYDGNFTLTHVSSYIEAKGSVEETTQLSILKGGETPLDGELLLSQEFENTDGTGFDTVLLKMPLVFEPGEKFWVVYTYAAVSIRLGYDEIENSRNNAYLVHFDGSWNDIHSIDGYEDYVWTIRAIESNLEGISFSLNSGTIQPGNSQEITIHYDARSLEHNGNYNYNVLVRSNDPVTPIETIECTATVSGFPAPYISVIPDTLNSVINGYENPIITETLTINNTGPGILTFDFAEIEEKHVEYHIPAVTSQAKRDIENISFKKSTYIDNSIVATTSNLLANGSLAYGYENSPNQYFVSLNTATPDTYLSYQEVNSTSIFAADFVGIDDKYLYVNDYDKKDLVKLNVETGESETIGTTSSFVDFAGDKSNDVLYGSFYDENSDYSYLYTVNTETAEATRIGGMCSGCIIAMACDGEGNLYGVNLLGSSFHSIDPNTGVATHIGYLGYTPNYAQSMAWDPKTDRIYLAAFNEETNRGELRIADKITGATELIGAFPGGAEISAFAFPGEGLPEFITGISPSSGTVEPNSSIQVGVEMDATKLRNGDYNSRVTIFSNDYDNSVVNVPVNLEVIGQVGDISANTDFIDFGTVFQYGKEETTFKLINHGIGDLTITGILSDNEEFTTNFSDTLLLEHMDSVMYTVLFNSNLTGHFNGILTILSDDPDNDSLQIPTVATAIEPPVIDLSPDNLELTLNSGKDTNVVLTISNTGTYPLHVSMPDTAVISADSVDGLPFDIIVSPSEGIIQPGRSQDINLFIDATELFDGTYKNEFVIANTDPLKSNLVFKSELQIVGIPELNIETTELKFDSIASGTEEIRQVVIKNFGSKELTVDSIIFDNAAFYVGEVTPFVIHPQADSIINVAFSPNEPKAFNGNMIVYSDDAFGNETVSILCKGTALIPPALTYSYTPNPADFVLNHGDTDTMTITLSNSGEASLEYFIIKPYYAVIDSVAVSSEEDMQDNSLALQSHSGSDDFGYSWIDSDISDEVRYKWIEISQKGKNLKLGDDNSVTIDLPFNFPFYEGSFKQVTVAANGFLTFGSDIGWEGGNNNKDIPSGHAPNYLIAPMWKDLQPNYGGGVYAYSTPDYVVVQYNEIPTFYGYGTATFEVVMYPNGDIKFQYKDVDDFSGVDESTIGIENIYGSKGLKMAYKSEYAKNKLAVMIHSPFLTGIVPSNKAATIDLLIETEQLVEGEYEMSTKITTNDPENKLVEVETSLKVNGSPEISVDETLSFDNVYYYRKEVFQTSKELTIYNTGTKDLVINSMQVLPDASIVTGSFNYPVTIAPGKSHIQELVFFPIQAGEYQCTLQIESNDTSVKGFTSVRVAGTALDVPEMEVSSLETLKLELKSKEVVNKTYSITNDGDSVLNYTIKPYYSISPGEYSNNSNSEYIVDLIDSIYYDPDKKTDGYNGFGSTATFTAANKFTVTTENFTLSHISNCYRNEGIKDSLRLQVWKGGNLPGQGTLALTQYFYHEEAIETGYYMVELKDTLEFNKGDVFFVVIRYPKSMYEPVAYNSEVPGVSGVSYFISIITNTWVKALAGEIYKIRAFQGAENSYVDNWLSLDQPTGALGKNGSHSPQLSIDASKAGAGVHKGTVKFVPGDRFNTVQELPVEISVNSAPVVSLKPASTLYVKETESLKFRVYGYDPDGGGIEYSLLENFDFITLSPMGDSIEVIIAPNYHQSGIYNAGVNLTDDEEESVLAGFTVIVEDVNLVPEIITAIDKRVYYIPQGRDKLKLTDYFVDYDGDTLTYSAENNDENICLVEVDSDMLYIEPVKIGASIVTVYATDSHGEYKSLTFNVEIRENQAPLLSASLNNVIIEITGPDSTFNLNNYFNDPDGHSLIYSSNIDSGNAVHVDIQENILRIHPLEVGKAKVIIHANDDYNGSVSAELTVIVESLTAINPNKISATNFSCYPNPVKNKAELVYIIERKGKVKLGLFNSKGLLVDLVVNEKQQAGEYRVEHIIDNLSAGLYFYRLSIDDNEFIKSTIVIKE
jgi:subtilisin family serine protease